MEQSKTNAKAVILAAIALAVSTYFEQKEAKKEVYSTADGFLFENLVFATNHASTLEDKNVTPHSNENNLEAVGEEEVTGDDYKLTAFDAMILKTGLAKENYMPMKSLIKNLKIETADQKAETLIKALEEYKTINPIE